MNMRTEPLPAPFFLKIIIAFFAFDAAAKVLVLLLAPQLRHGFLVLFLGIHYYGEHPELDRMLATSLIRNAVYFSFLLIIVFDVLLVVQLVLRSAAGRVWALAFSVSAAAWTVYISCFQPIQWMSYGWSGRLALLFSLALYVLIFIYFIRPTAKKLFVN